MLCSILLVAALSIAAESSPPSAAAPQARDFQADLARYRDWTYSQLLGRLPRRHYLDRPALKPVDAKYYDLVLNKLMLMPQEQDVLRRNGFVVVHREADKGFPQLYIRLYNDDLPLLVTTDSLLHAMHRAYDDILQELETNAFHYSLDSILSRCHAELAARSRAGVDPRLRVNYADVDLYLTVALSLLDGRQRASATGEDAKVAEILAVIGTLEMQLPKGTLTEIYGSKRTLDASQFKPRGHYTKSEAQQRYFRAMMWLGRADCGLNVLPTKLKNDSRRELRDAVVLTDLLNSSGAMKQLEEMDRVVAFLVGGSDNMTPLELARLLEKQRIAAPAGVIADADVIRLQEAIRAAGLGRQQIQSQVLSADPHSPNETALPCLFQVFGQRYAIDSFVLSQVVYDSISFHEDKPWRRIPSGLDVFFALGNDGAAPLLADGLTRYNYSGNLLACRDFVAAQPAAFWRANLYNIWLDTLRALDDDPAAQPKFPQAMRTEAWRRKQTQTQLASWAELRHDNILYAKSPYGKHGECEYPGAFVEPYPKVYASIKFFYEEAARRIEAASFQCDPTRNDRWKGRQIEFLRASAATLARLEALARKELAAEPFTEDDSAWLKLAVREKRCDSGDNTYDGWYCKLFYHPTEREMLPWMPVVADVHSAPPVFGEGPLPGVPAVLEAGTGGCDYVVAVIDNQADQALYVGPVYSYYEFPQPAKDRLGDEQWQAMVQRGIAPPRPAWTEAFRAAR